MRPEFFVAFLLSSVVAGFFNCQGDHVVILNAINSTFSFNNTQIAGNSNCQYNFTFSSDYAAEIRIDGWNMNSATMRIKSQWDDNTQSIAFPDPTTSPANDSLHVMWPPTYFLITIQTNSDSSMVLSGNVSIKQIPDQNPKLLYTTSSQQPNFVQFMDWKEDTSITAQSTSSGKLALNMASPLDLRYEYANIFVYDWRWDARQFRGTLYSLVYIPQDPFYMSANDTLTFYRALDNDVIATLIINDYDNMKKLSNFHVVWSPNNLAQGFKTSFTLYAADGIYALTVLNEADGSNAIYLLDVVYLTPNVNDTSSVKAVAGGMVRDYDDNLLGFYSDPKTNATPNYPQYFPGMARTFILERGQATISYTSVSTNTNDSVAYDGRNGFVMSNNYGFWSTDQDSEEFVLNSADGNPFSFSYTIQHQSSNEDAYLNFTLNELSDTTSFVVDLCNLTSGPGPFNFTTLSMSMNINGGNGSSDGSYIFYQIHNADDPTSTAEPNSGYSIVPVTNGGNTDITTTATTTDGTSLGPTFPSTPDKHPLKTILICLGGLLLILLVILLILWLRYRIRRGKYRKFWSTISGVLPIAVKVDEWELGDKQLEIFEDKELGRGAFGIVYEGELHGDRPVDRIVRSMQKMTGEKRQSKVAVKRLPLNAEYQARSDFIEEINFMKKLGYHPHILGMIGCITATSMPLIVLDYCENGDLLSWVRKNKYSTDMRPEQLLSIAWQISDGLCYLKSLGLIHRDLAARNILLTAELVAKISDFGLCRKPENSDDSATYLPNFYVSRGGRLPVKWLAPESLRDFRFSFKTDLWSYGVILWEMYTFGDVPFGDVNPLNLFELLESGERLPQGYIPDDMYKLMASCWDAVPGKRTPIEKIKEILHEMMTTSCNFYGYLTMTADDGDGKEKEMGTEDVANI